MTTRLQPPTGELVLVDYFHESSSGHYDESRRVTLVAGADGQIEMIEITDSCDQFKGPRAENRSCITIDPEELIRLIYANKKDDAS